MREQEWGSISKFASILNRVSHIYYDVELAEFGIGCGQQFFLLRIAEIPGISLISLAKEGSFDKGTAARAVKKLEELGYVRRVVDSKDKRVTRLFVTPQAEPVIQITLKVLDDWQRILSEGLSEEEQIQVEMIMEKIADNACSYMKMRGKESII